MILSSACQPQADPFPAPSGRHGERRSYTTPRDTIVKLFDGHKHSPTSRRPHECFCKPTVREIGQSRGAAHLKLVFMLMTGTRQNARELYADMIKAVSRLLVNHPDLVRRPSLVDDFNAKDLGRMRRQVRSIKCGVPTSDALLVLLSVKFKPAEGNIEATGEAA